MTEQEDGMSDVPEQVFMPSGWDGYDGTVAVEHQAEPDDLVFIRSDLVIRRDAPELVALVEALRKSANRLEWCAGLIYADNARDKASEWADEARTSLEAYEALK